MRVATIKKAFNFPLSEQRLAEIAREIGDKLERANMLEAAFDAAKEAKKEVPALLQSVREKGHYIKTGAEEKMIECRIEYDTPEAGVKRIVRTDTDEVVDTLEMTGEELQGDFFVGNNGSLSLPEKPPSDSPDEQTGETASGS